MKLMSKDKIRGTKAVSFNMSIKYSNDNKTLGVQTFDNGDIYTGGFLEGKKHGHGVLKTRSERVYDGEWQVMSHMGMESIHSQMEKFIKVNTKKVSHMETVNGHIVMERPIRVNG